MLEGEIVEETIYNPYNENNKEISHNIVKKILGKYHVFYNINTLEFFQRSFIHKSYVKPKVACFLIFLF